MRGTVIAALVAGVILTIAVLPAEYGIDPTGIGGALGLTSLHRAAAAAAPAAAEANAAASPVPRGSQVSAAGEVRVLT